MKKWEILGKLKNNDLTLLLLKNRGISTKKEIDNFLNSKLEDITIENLGIDKKNLKKSVDRIKSAIKNKEQVIVFGDYDVDGITGAAIIWETLNTLGAKVLPYIPHRIDEGYGLSIKGIENLKSQIPDIKLIITVDNGIVANEAVDFSKKQGIDVIITDHHVPSKNLPQAYSIIHTTKLCGAGVGWMLCKELKKSAENHLELVALATIADLVPLTNANRTIVKFGLDALRKTKRLGLLEIFKASGIDKNLIGVYEIGHMIAPRLNAMGRLESAMDSLRLLCTTSKDRAINLSLKLSSTNINRQEITRDTILHAISQVEKRKDVLGNILFISDVTYQQGVIGLVAGRLVEKYYLPSIVVSVGEIYSKASARSVSGFNIIEFIRSASDILVDAGGHPMAAGFTVETTNLAILKERFETSAKKVLSKETLTQSIKIDCEIPLNLINKKIYDEIQKLSPFGMANPIPTFVSKGVFIKEQKLVGKEGNHVKFKFENDKKMQIEGIGFNLADKISEFKVGDKADIVYAIDENVWNGRKSLQLKIRDIK